MKNDKKVPRIFTLNDPTKLRIIPALTIEIGLNESIMLMQLEYLVSISTTDEKEGRHWTYQSVRELKDNYFPFWSIATINRTIQKLEKEGYITVSDFNKKKYDKTRWISINYDKVDKLESVMVGGVFQNDTRSNQNETRPNQNETTIPEIPSEIPSDIKDSVGEKTPPSARDEILEKLREAEKEYNKPKKDLDLVDGILHFEEEYIDRKEKLGIVLDNLYDYPSDIQEVIKAFCNKWKKPPPPKKAKTFAKWIKDAREVKIMCQNAHLSPKEVFDEAYYVWKTPPRNMSRKEYDGGFNVYDIGSVVSLTWESIGNILNGTPRRKVRIFTDASGKQIEKEI